MTQITIIVLCIVLAASHVGAYFMGRDATATAQRDQALAYAGEIVRRQGTVDALAADLEAERQKRIPKNRTITREVVRYVELPAARRCTLDPAWRLLHDAAARLAAADAAPVADAAALDTVAANYEQCRDTHAQLVGWQQWWRAVQTSARAGE
ncbi:hypothetical protein MXC99_01055 [Thauera aromatica]|uniref:hypothetical protein n=1 Tax=Thauera aromatica TaxID=59405 RepID=UPI001FFCB709|nr:hypothetical protein [Thauera aromatica]MCK2086781.1 hypothetical protein [Thauera aromatica]